MFRFHLLWLCSSLSIAFPLLNALRWESNFENLILSLWPWVEAIGVLCRCGEQRWIAAALIKSCKEIPFLTHRYDYLQQCTEVIHYANAKRQIKREAQRWAAVIPGKISEEKKQSYKASIDLCLVVLRGPMQSIIDLTAIIQRPVWNKENICAQRNTPPHRLNMRKSLL